LPAAWIALIIIYGTAKPSVFLTWANVSNILGSQAVLFVLALAALMPSFVGDFDLSLGGVLGLTAMVVGVLNTQHHMAIASACFIGILVAVAAGCLNGFFVVTCDTNPLIVTLGMGTVFTGLIYFLSGSNTITGIDQSLSAWTFTNK
jgi:ribose transport system permease protein